MGSRESTVDSIIVQCMNRHSKALYSNRRGGMSNKELYDELIKLLWVLGEATENHGHSLKLDNAKQVIWNTVENNKILRTEYENN